MPIYEYQCTACGHQLEALQKMSDAPLKDCPKCNQPALNKLVSAAGFQLKGSGWYMTDYSNKGKSKSAAEQSSGAVSEKKPAEKVSTETKESKASDKPKDNSGASST